MSKALILGGSGGIGLEIIRKLLSTGSDVINIDKKKCDITHGKLRNIVVDLQFVSRTELIKKLLNEEKQIDCFISSIGYYNPNAQNTLEEYTKNIEINLNIPTEFSIALLEHMSGNANGGKIVLITSEAAIGGSRTLGYSASKAGIEGVRRYLALETSKSNIHVYSIAPGIIHTSMATQASKERQASTIMRTYEQRMGLPDEVAELVLYLATSAPSYMKGQCISIDGGLASRYR